MVVLTAISTGAMFHSLGVAFGGNLLDTLKYASGGVVHLPYLNLIGAILCVFALPRATGHREYLPPIWMLFMTPVIAFLAMKFVDMQLLVKTAILRAQDPFVTASTLLLPMFTWCCILLLGYSRTKSQRKGL